MRAFRAIRHLGESQIAPLTHPWGPLHTDALCTVEQDPKIYIPRPELESELGSWLVSENRGGIFVEGSVGVGKTTLVNRTQLAVHKIP